LVSFAFMMEMAACPACRQWVALRSPWADDLAVRCPHCRAEYVAGDARKHAVPALIPLDPAAAAASVQAASVQAVEESSEAADDAVWPDVRNVAPAAAASRGDAWPRVGQATKTNTSPPTTVARRPKRKPGNPVVEIAKMAAGGAAGLAVGYVILLWVGGPRNDFFNILPRLPRWLRPPSARSTLDDLPAWQSGLADKIDSGKQAFDQAATSVKETDQATDLSTTTLPSKTEPARSNAASSGAEVRQAVAAVEETSDAVSGGKEGAARSPDQRAVLAATAWERLVDRAARLPASDPERQAALAAISRLVAQRAADAEKWNRRAAEELGDDANRSKPLVLTGRLQQVERRGDWFQSHLVLAGSPTLVTIVSAQPLEFKTGDDLAVFGLLVTRPRDRFPGYDGPAQGAVVHPGAVVRFAAPAKIAPPATKSL